MDLNTVMKKLKTFQYTNKKQFVDDLMLIWQNCLTYNSDPKHFLRADAFAMQKKTATLIPLIPDITVRDRSEVEKEAALAAAQNEDHEEKKAGATSTRGASIGDAKMAKKGRKGHKGAEAVDSPAPAAGDDSEKADTPVQVKQEHADGDSALIEKAGLGDGFRNFNLEKSNFKYQIQALYREIGFVR
ncbi:unnamed protein product [Ambrosiozyma monospora]|uniref:Unnamed protein product n=1 Tax=Ambrosiozyma monospora TaxID=43982 RepID=A0A9W6WE40_AMBMO|nr:unnamed protein product [Ambrosiozyma monospora]